MNRKRIIKKLQNKFDRQAIDQLRAEIERLGHKVDELEQHLEHAHSDADFWHERAITALHFNEEENPPIGLTQEGTLVNLNMTHNNH